MPIIASHHASDPYRPSCAWTDKTHVQWGGRGLVIRGDESGYTTAFFEAFPNDNASGFIRGEGKTIEEAEKNAFAKWSREVVCDHSHWQRKGYTNSLGFCAKCGAGKSVFKPIFEIGSYRKPIAKMLDWDLDRVRAGEQIDPVYAKMRHRLRIQKKVFGVKQPGEASGIAGIMEKITERFT